MQVLFAGNTTLGDSSCRLKNLIGRDGSLSVLFHSDLNPEDRVSCANVGVREVLLGNRTVCVALLPDPLLVQ